MIEIQQLRKSFGKLKVLEGIDLNFNQAGITAILGPNSSGKSTLLKCILGLVIPDQGTIRFAGQDIKDRWAYRKQLGYLPQIARFPGNLRVRELFQMVKDLRGQEAQEQELIRRFALEPFLHKPLGQLSGGTRQKVNLVQTFMYDHPVLILDEPTSGLDPVAMLTLRDLLWTARDQGKIILLTTHILSFVEEMAENLIFLLDGRVQFSGSVMDLKQNYAEDDLEIAIANLLRNRAYA